jgi:L-alanine-DL-glutamate epimerase-like enolase superfamily enzyme
LGKDPLQIELHNRHFLNFYLGFASTGMEVRGASAIDIALWDIFGQDTGKSICQLLGGASRERVRTYNTCAGYHYMREKPEQSVSNWGVAQRDAKRPYEDLHAFLNNADELALSLIEEGYQGMKIWPFDPYAEASGGTHIAAEELKVALSPFEKIRRVVGDKIDVHVEFHSMWNLPMAIKLAQVLEPYQPYWYEDPLKMSNLDALVDYARRTRVWVTASETLATRWGFRPLFEKQAISVCMFDIGWTGGLTEAKKIAAMAECYHLPIAPHDCTGPVLLTAAVHLSQNATNTLVQEIVRSYYHDWYRDIVTELPPLERGYIRIPQGAGLGTRLLPDLKSRPGVAVRRTAMN